jgi:hypothetical protein
MIENLTYTLPTTVEDHYAIGTFTNESGEVYFEIPAIFNEDGTCDEQRTIEKINTNIQFMNK